MASSTTNESEIKSWLQVLLKNENLKDFSIQINGNSEKGDGYMGDIIFVSVTGSDTENFDKVYNIVLKCSKRSTVLREKSPVKESFLNEIFFYNTIFPRFLQFQKDRNVDDVFDKVPKCYGTLIKEGMEILALENLKLKGYTLWDRKTPLTRKHIDLIIREFAKLHSVSITMKKQDLEEFEKMANKLEDVLAKFMMTSGMVGNFENSVQEVFDLLQNELEESVLLKWKTLKDKIQPFWTIATQKLDAKYMTVITHGDCWCNNFLHYHINGQPSSFVMLDWQLSNYSSPIFDLSYFLFSCLSQNDMDDLDIILKYYHDSLMKQLRKLGISYPEEIYSLGQFLNEWKKFCKFGITLSTVIHKFTQAEGDNVPDMVEAAENGEDIVTTFVKPIENVEGYKKRMSYIVKYVVEHDLI